MVTEGKQAEAKIRQHTARIEALFESLIFYSPYVKNTVKIPLDKSGKQD